MGSQVPRVWRAQPRGSDRATGKQPQQLDDDRTVTSIKSRRGQVMTVSPGEQVQRHTMRVRA